MPTRHVVGRDETLLPYEVRAHTAVPSGRFKQNASRYLRHSASGHHNSDNVQLECIAASSVMVRVLVILVDVHDNGAIPDRVADRLEAIERNREEVTRRMKEYAETAEREMGGLFDGSI